MCSSDQDRLNNKKAAEQLHKAYEKKIHSLTQIIESAFLKWRISKGRRL
jgi:hypothetical protein